MEQQTARNTRAEQVDMSTLVAAIQALTQNVGMHLKSLTTIANALSTLLIT